jgi:hypothetical protein
VPCGPGVVEEADSSGQVSDVVQEENEGPGSRTLGRPGGTAEGQKHCQHLEGFLSFNLGRGGKLQPNLVYAMSSVLPLLLQLF